MLKRNRTLPQVGGKSAENYPNLSISGICINYILNITNIPITIITGQNNQDENFITQREHCVFLDT